MGEGKDHETAFVDAFVVPTKRARLHELLLKPKRRRSVLESLYHQAPLDARFMCQVAPAAQSAAGIEALLRAKGATDECYIMSTDATLDGTTLPLTKALSLIVGRGEGAIASCIPGQLAYYESEDPGERYVLERRGGRTTRCS